jgi:uncharacterized protein (TIGR03435 family)
MRREEEDIAIALKTLLPSDEHTGQACERVSSRLRSTVTWEEDATADELFQAASGFRWQRMMAVAAAGLVLLIISAAVLRHSKTGDANKVVDRSRAPEYLALPSQQTGLAQAIQSVNPAGVHSKESSAVFEVASIRLGDPSRGGGRGVGPLACGGDIQVEPRRFVADSVTLYRLIAIAYGKDCIFLEQNGELLQGGPDWVRSDGFTIQALMPEGSPVYTRNQLNAGKAPGLQAMLLNLLADRFKLVMRSEMKEMPVYSLMPVKGITKLVPWKEGQPSSGFVGMAGRGEQRSFHIIGGKKSMADLATQLEDAIRRTVLDQTDITGEFNYDIQYVPVGNQVGAEMVDGVSGPALFTAIQEQLGLKLEATRAPVQVLTIDRALKPSEN